uniref:Uncharacterized protein n=1 Tax=Sinocyclocheilus grahami TaxID=75366 RepID=A0A672KLQ3_SINGR
VSLASPLILNFSNLRELDLSENKLGDSGVKLLFAGPESHLSKLATFKLVNCGVTDEGCAALASALTSNPSHLRELDLSGNKVEDSGVQMLSGGLENYYCQLETLSFSSAEKMGESVQLWRAETMAVQGCQSTPWPGPMQCDVTLHRESKRCSFCRLMSCGITDEGCAALSSALTSNPTHLRWLDLSKNKLSDSGINLLSTGLSNPHCKLEMLGYLSTVFLIKYILVNELYYYCSLMNHGCRLCFIRNPFSYRINRQELHDCDVTDEGCAALASALRSNPSYLKELDLSDNKLGDLGVKLLSIGLEDCKLEILNRFE